MEASREVYTHHGTPWEVTREVYLSIHTQGGYQGGIPLYIHPGRLPRRYTSIYTPREATHEVYPGCITVVYIWRHIQGV